MKTLHVSVTGKKIATEITEEGESPSFIPVTECDIYFTVKIDSEHVATTRDRLRKGISPTRHLEEEYRRVFQALSDQEFTITPPDK